MTSCITSKKILLHCLILKITFSPASEKIAPLPPEGAVLKIEGIQLACLQVHDQVSSNIILTVATLEEI